MMFEIIGKERISYFSKKAQKQVEGTRLYLMFMKESIDGAGCKEIFISDKLGFTFADFVVGSSVKVYYNEYGNVADIIFS